MSSELPSSVLVGAAARRALTREARAVNLYCCRIGNTTASKRPWSIGILVSSSKIMASISGEEHSSSRVGYGPSSASNSEVHALYLWRSSLFRRIRRCAAARWILQTLHSSIAFSSFGWIFFQTAAAGLAGMMVEHTRETYYGV